MKKSNLPIKSNGLVCAICGKDLSATMSGNVVFVKECDELGRTTDKILDVVLVCKECDAALQANCRKKGLSAIYWNELYFYTNPLLWLSNLRDFINDLIKGNYTPQAAEKMKAILWDTFPWVSRDLADDEKENALELLSI